MRWVAAPCPNDARLGMERGVGTRQLMHSDARAGCGGRESLAQSSGRVLRRLPRRTRRFGCTLRPSTVSSDQGRVSGLWVGFRVHQPRGQVLTHSDLGRPERRFRLGHPVFAHIKA
jgi:hypothetical protein